MACKRHKICWFQRVKDKEFESNSQHLLHEFLPLVGWFQRVKDKTYCQIVLLKRVSTRFILWSTMQFIGGELKKTLFVAF